MLFIYSYLLYYAVFYGQLYGIKNQVELVRETSHFSQDELTVLSFKKSRDGSPNAHSLTWRGDEEFWYEGKLYDVMTQKQSADSIYFYCTVDDDENELLKELDNYMSDIIDFHSSEKKNQLKFKFLQRDFICQSIAEGGEGGKQHLIHNGQIDCALPSCFLAVESPPPVSIFIS
jgi:hypothetical protein